MATGLASAAGAARTASRQGQWSFTRGKAPPWDPPGTRAAQARWPPPGPRSGRPRRGRRPPARRDRQVDSGTRPGARGLPEVLVEVGHRPLPGELGRGRIEARRRVVVEAVLRAGIEMALVADAG